MSTPHILRLAKSVTITPQTDLGVVRLVEAIKADTSQTATMKTEWGVEVEGKIPDTWYQLNLHGLVPHHYADATWLETREDAESLMADVMEGELYPNARFVHRYVTETISNEDPYR